MKKLVLTIAIGEDYRQLAILTHPTIKAYAGSIGADFIAITEPALSKTTPHWEKFQIFHYLQEYDRIIYIDTDVIIRDDCPDLFSIVPETHLGMFEEGRFTTRGYDLMLETCKAYNVVLPEWNGKYYNSGVMVISKVHRSMFKKPEKEIPNFFEQSYLNMLIAKRETDMFELTHKFNRMTCMDRFTGEERFDSFVIHYAGWYWKASEAGSPSNTEYIFSLVRNDLNRWKTDRPHYKYHKHIYISVTGGMGDQLCAEPAIRWMKEKLYPHDEMIIATHYPRFFMHIGGIEVVEHGKANLKPDTPYYLAESLPNPETVQWSIVSHLLCHCVDYIAIALMHRTLPVMDKTIRFVVDQVDYEGLREKTGGINLREFTAVHAGRHWNSKTFPADYWQRIVIGLIEKGEKVVMVGKTDRGDPPFYKAGARGVVNIDYTGTLNLVDKLTIGEFAALLSQTKTLISNDSFPVHLAGAFDNEIILIPSCKHPDHVLPWRNGQIYYKAKADYKRLVIDDIESRPTQVYPTSAEVDEVNWSNYLNY